MPKPKNNGAVLSVRIPHEVHAAVHNIMAVVLESQQHKMTAGEVVADAIRFYYKEWRKVLGKVDQPKTDQYMPSLEVLTQKVEP